jgi:hypothetical protein
MRHSWVTLIIGAVAAAVAAGAQAQAYRWTDQNGNVAYGDVPPPGVHATPIDVPSASAAPASGAKAPLTPAEQDKLYWKQQAEQERAQQKAEQAQQQAASKAENCASAQEGLRVLQSGQRVSGVNTKGERYYLDDAQRAEQTSRAERAVKQWCN